MEKQCTFLIFDESVSRAETDELAAGLESPDVKSKSATLKKIIMLMLNGEQLGSLLMKVIQYIVPNEDKGLKKLLYLYLEAVEKRSPDGNLLPEMILICNMIRNDLNHPNEFVRGSALRFLSKMREKDILEPLVASLRANLEHRHSYVRRNSVLAIYNTFKCFEDLMPDAPELIGEFIDGESDVSAKRNAFVMLCNSDQERAVQYQLSVIDSISSMGDIIQLVMLELIRKEVLTGFLLLCGFATMGFAAVLTVLAQRFEPSEQARQRQPVALCTPPVTHSMRIVTCTRLPPVIEMCMRPAGNQAEPL